MTTTAAAAAHKIVTAKARYSLGDGANGFVLFFLVHCSAAQLLYAEYRTTIQIVSKRISLRSEVEL